MVHTDEESFARRDLRTLPLQGEQGCKAQLKIEVFKKSGACTVINVLSNLVEHDHSDQTAPKQSYNKMPSPVKQAVRLGLSMGQTATQIKDYCLEQNIDTLYFKKMFERMMEPDNPPQ